MEEATAASASMEQGTSSSSRRPSAPLLEGSDDGDFFDSQQRRAGRDDEDDEARAGKSDGAEYTAAEIAERFVDVIDGKAPIDSVKGAVGKFGGILDWKERRQQVQDELDKVQGEAAEYQRRSQEAEAGKAEAVQELMGATGEIDDLWLSVKRAQIAEAQARKDSELAKLRLRKTEKGARERAPARAELDAVRDRHAAALADLRSVRAELEALQKERDAAAGDADAASTRARETTGEATEAGQALRETAAELAALREELDSARAAHDAAEERRMRVALVWQEDKVQWQTELEQGEQEARRLRDELVVAGDLEAKVAAASEQLANLRAELFARAVQGAGEEQEMAAPAVMGKTKEEVEEVKASLEKAKDEARILRVAAASLRVDLEKEKEELAALRRNKEAASSSSPASVPSLEEELSRVTAELAAAQATAKEGGGEESETTAEQVSEARREAEQAKARAKAAQEEVAGAREDARVAKAAVQTVEARLEAVMREILAATASAEVATASADALLQQQEEESKPAQSQGDGVALSTEEYEELSRRARETEEAAGKRVTEAVKQIKEAKDAEVRSLENLAQLARQSEQRRQALLAATAEAEEAESGKAAAERELRRWQADHRRSETASPSTGLAEISTFDDRGGNNPHILSPRGGYMPRSADMTPAALAAAEEADARQKKNFFPRMVMFLARKRAQTWNGK